ncbi:MAG: YigZ family protein [Prolixibacteraceae bacterium]|nr:YigZ family protein [Prolixibacteraceae bacterium]
MQDTYKSIKTGSKGFFKDKGSKFYAYASPVKSEDEIKEILAAIKKEHHSARHHCFAWRLGADGSMHRANDDGEPSYTAGKPILGQLQSFDVTNVLIVVVRYFGGTLLGTAGLINAYRTAAADALSNAKIITCRIETEFNLKYSYEQTGEVMRIIKQENLKITGTQFYASCKLDFSVRKSEASRIEQLFSQLPGITITTKSPP